MNNKTGNTWKVCDYSGRQTLYFGIHAEVSAEAATEEQPTPPWSWEIVCDHAADERYKHEGMEPTCELAKKVVFEKVTEMVRARAEAIGLPLCTREKEKSA